MIRSSGMQQGLNTLVDFGSVVKGKVEVLSLLLAQFGHGLTLLSGEFGNSLTLSVCFGLIVCCGGLFSDGSVFQVLFASSFLHNAVHFLSEGCLRLLNHSANILFRLSYRLVVSIPLSLIHSSGKIILKFRIGRLIILANVGSALLGFIRSLLVPQLLAQC
jgi:hypothetical protein